MKVLKLIGLAFIYMAKQVWSLPKTLSDAAKQRQHRTMLYKLEAERLDRIRNPDKYLGK